MPGIACTVALLALVATNTTSSVTAGVPPGPEAVMMEGPAVVDDTVTPGVSPAAFVVDGLPATVPRLAEKVTALFDCATPASFQLIATALAVFSGMSMVVAGATSTGAVKAKLALLMVSAWTALAPAAVAVIRSLPAVVAVTAAIT